MFRYINVKKLPISMINTIFISYWCRDFYFVLILHLFVYFYHWLVYQDPRLPNTWKNFGNFYRNRKNVYYIYVTGLVITIFYLGFFLSLFAATWLNDWEMNMNFFLQLFHTGYEGNNHFRKNAWPAQLVYNYHIYRFC